ncbi:threonine/homoserine/homoserine lactone efflux protein [Roseibium hamelinense]|uniref:Threonine/homoserine/homoserine lactone efflux protein n=1 Tax=Roseibium hamelinense TaxID=150831 RepID=A0A562SLZ4_9HYPH|nr:LysE family transporter [Roseibium hamelinense]MTI44980.1 lysine transporter LysE [Roseibium hamelinense]TWI82242.1 threonine/homoserine/homoserine lactone efflux protein [Roseibium hamelinense]
MIELFAVISLTIVVAVVPGPDFAVVLRNALVGGRLAGVMTALGIALALGVHVTYAIAGIGLIVSQSIFLFNALKLIGAAYLVFLGATMFRTASSDVSSDPSDTGMVPLKALRWGFLTNVTNPKATMFALSVFLQVTSPNTSVWTKVGYGTIMAGGVFLWFVFVTLFFTLPPVRNAFLRIKIWMERSFGVLLTLFGIGLAATTNSSRP